MIRETVAQSYIRKGPVVPVYEDVTFVGLDAHAKDINVAVISPGSGVIREQWQVAREARSLRRLVKKLLTMAPGEVRAVYEAGSRVKRGAITKAGNTHVRRILVEAAWSYWHRPAVSASLRKRRQGQPPAVIAIADRSQFRLHRRYFRLKEGWHKPHNVVTVAIARELVGFIWAVLHHEHGPQSA